MGRDDDENIDKLKKGSHVFDENVCNNIMMNIRHSSGFIPAEVSDVYENKLPTNTFVDSSVTDSEEDHYTEVDSECPSSEDTRKIFYSLMTSLMIICLMSTQIWGAKLMI